jgi:hypothetical protein
MLRFKRIKIKIKYKNQFGFFKRIKLKELENLSEKGIRVLRG